MLDPNPLSLFVIDSAWDIRKRQRFVFSFPCTPA
ncbi:hypothetical protein CR513_44581 [Mucuna pruriens]|uniref:Uncharacterized protein n=1 Tax=Mucuna pruriens TaxID=157652 RepID=A0A371FB46_MUCPR|nr:hypothetical protein CR513_44581 [Mucuna pruriens]